MQVQVQEERKEDEEGVFEADVEKGDRETERQVAGEVARGQFIMQPRERLCKNRKHVVLGASNACILGAHAPLARYTASTHRAARHTHVFCITRAAQWCAGGLVVRRIQCLRALQVA